MSVDPFKIKKIYQDKAGGPSWNSLHWNNGKSRTVSSGSKDPSDPTNCSENRGNCTWSVDGKGMLIFNGKVSGTAEPRLHLNNPSKYFFKDVEATFYMMRIKDNNTNWGGCCLGVRSGPNGHSISKEYCDAHTYYQRIRNDGTCDTEKELKHPDSSARSSKLSWPNGTKFPFNQWIGYKSVTYNLPDKKGVKFELYRDLTGGVNGGDWKMICTTSDVGGWAPSQKSPACSYAKDYIPLEGGGVIVMRNTGTTSANYKWMTVREIVPTKCPENDELSREIPFDGNEDGVEFTEIFGECTSLHSDEADKADCVDCVNCEPCVDCDEIKEVEIKENNVDVSEEKNNNESEGQSNWPCILL